MSIKKFFKGTPILISELDPMDPKQYRWYWMTTVVPMGVAVLVASFVYVSLYKINAAWQFLFLVLITLGFLGFSKWMHKKMTRCALARIKSIDPEYPGGLLDSVILYSPLFFLIFTFFLMFKKPGSMQGRFYPAVRKIFYGTLGTLFLLLVLLVLVRPSGGFRCGKLASFWLAGPGPYFVVSLMEDVSKTMQLKDRASDLSDQEFLQQAGGLCSSHATQDTLLLAQAVIWSAGKLKGLEKDDPQRFTKFNNVIHANALCENKSPFPSTFNPVWAFIPLAVGEGSLILVIESAVSFIFIKKEISLINLKIDSFYETRDKAQVDQMQREFRKSLRYRRYQQIQSNPILKKIF